MRDESKKLELPPQHQRRLDTGEMRESEAYSEIIRTVNSKMQTSLSEEPECEENQKKESEGVKNKRIKRKLN